MEPNSRLLVDALCPHKQLDLPASSLIAILDMELAAKSPRLLDQFRQRAPAHVAKLDPGRDGSDALLWTGRTIPHNAYAQRTQK